MDERDWLAERFQEHRPRLRAVAYRAWLVTAVGRVALNMLRARKTRREEPLDAHLPDPIVDRVDGIDAARAARLRPPRHVREYGRGRRRGRPATSR